MTTDAGQVTDGDITIDSNHETAEQISAAFETDDTPVADAAPAALNVAHTQGLWPCHGVY